MIDIWLRLTRTYHPEHYTGTLGRTCRNLDIAMANVKLATVLVTVALVVLVTRLAA